jgi:hypothetical protein
MSRLAMRGMLFGVLFLLFYKNRFLSTLLIVVALLTKMEGGRWSPLLKEGLRMKEWVSSELNHSVD